LVVDFLPEDFLPPAFADLLELFFAMALASFLGDKFTRASKSGQRFFLVSKTFFAMKGLEPRSHEVHEAGPPDLGT
jgi:hypothetical protein